jgi:hypothetical protein
MVTATAKVIENCDPKNDNDRAAGAKLMLLGSFEGRYSLYSRGTKLSLFMFIYMYRVLDACLKGASS